MDTENQKVTENRTTYAVWIGDRSGSGTEFKEKFSFEHIYAFKSNITI